MLLVRAQKKIQKKSILPEANTCRHKQNTGKMMNMTGVSSEGSERNKKSAIGRKMILFKY